MINPYGAPYVTTYDATYDTFGSLNLTEGDTLQSFTEPMTVEEVKGYLRLDSGYTDDDPLITSMISAARDQAEIFQNRDLVRKQWDLSYDYWPQYRIPLRAPTVSVDLVQYKDLTGAVTTMTADTQYVSDLKKQPGIITPPWNSSWPAFTPYPSSAILIRFTSGFAPDSSWWQGSGSRVKMGMVLLISSWYENRLPFTPGARNDAELPFAVTSCLSNGRLERAR